MSLFSGLSGAGGGLFGGGPSGGTATTWGAGGSSAGIHQNGSPAGPSTVSSSIFHSTYREFMRLLASDVMAGGASGAGAGGDRRRNENDMGGVMQGFRRQSTKRQSLLPGSAAATVAAALRRTLDVWSEEFAKTSANANLVLTSSTTINALPDKLLVEVLSYLPPADRVHRCALVCKRWHEATLDGRLWRCVNLRPDLGGFLVRDPDTLVGVIASRLGASVRTFELPCELVTVAVLSELANRCPALRHLSMDFASAMQLHEYADLNTFPCNLRTLTICLSDVIFLEGLMRRIYTYLSSLEVLHLYGTYENPASAASGAEEQSERLNIAKVKAATPNLRVLVLYGVLFINDTHLETVASNSPFLECLSCAFCVNVKGQALRSLVHKCRRLRTLLLQQCEVEDRHVQAAEWEQAGALSELDLTNTALSADCLLDVLLRAPALTWLAVAYCDHFNDHVMETLLDNNKFERLAALDVSYTTGLNEPALQRLLARHGARLHALLASGKPKLTEAFWLQAIPLVPNLRTCVLGTAHGWFLGLNQRNHVDQIIARFAQYTPRLEALEIQWDPDSIRFTDKSSKFIDLLRMRCPQLKKVTLSDGEYYELVRANFERAGMPKVVRTTVTYNTSALNFLHHFADLCFN